MSFTSNALLLPHKKRQDAKGELQHLYCCELCGASFSSQFVFFGHLKSHYEPQQLYVDSPSSVPPLPPEQHQLSQIISSRSSQVLSNQHDDEFSSGSDEMLVGINGVVEQVCCMETETLVGAQQNGPGEEEHQHQLQDHHQSHHHHHHQQQQQHQQHHHHHHHHHMLKVEELEANHQQQKRFDSLIEYGQDKSPLGFEFYQRKDENSVSTDFEDIFANNIIKSFIKADQTVSDDADQTGGDDFEEIFEGTARNGTEIVEIDYDMNVFNGASNSATSPDTDVVRCCADETTAEASTANADDETPAASHLSAEEPPPLDGDRKRFQCADCSKYFRSPQSLRYHLLTHRNVRDYTCDHCQQTFLARSTLKIHLRIHRQELPYPCQLCDHKFRQKTALIYHTQSMHTAEQDFPFQCDYCGKKFARKYSLIVHRRVHTGEKNYKCDLCGKTFTTSSYLQKHMATHKNERLHACSLCTAAFNVKADLMRHLKIHERLGIVTLTPI